MANKKKIKNLHAQVLGRKGGAATALKGSDYFRMIGRLRINPGRPRMPDDQVKPNAIYERAARVRRKQAKLEAQLAMEVENSS